MKSLLLPILSIFAFTAFAEKASLPMSMEPLKCDVMHSETWDFSRQGVVDEDAKMEVRVYGDSLLAEFFDGYKL